MTDDQDPCAEEAGDSVGRSPAWLDPIREAAEKAFADNPGKPPAPEVTARLRRILPPQGRPSVLRGHVTSEPAGRAHGAGCHTTR